MMLTESSDDIEGAWFGSIIYSQQFKKRTNINEAEDPREITYRRNKELRWMRFDSGYCPHNNNPLYGLSEVHINKETDNALYIGIYTAACGKCESNLKQRFYRWVSDCEKTGYLKCCCGFKTSDTGIWMRHISICKKYKTEEKGE